MSKHLLTGALGGLIGLVAAAASANSIVVGGTPDPANLDRSFSPFGDLTGSLASAIDDAVGAPPTPRYQQVYDASNFLPIPIRITELRFFESSAQPSGTPALLGGTTCSDSSPECGLFTVRLSTTTKPVNMLETGTTEDDTGFNNNLMGNTEVFVADVLLSDVFSAGVLTFAGDPYVYDPANGNLIIDVVIGSFVTSTDLTQSLNTLFFQATDDEGFPGEDPPYSFVDNFDGNDNNSFGLVTGFEFTTIPEPNTAVLVAGGLVGMSAWRRRRIHASWQSGFVSPL